MGAAGSARRAASWSSVWFAGIERGMMLRMADETGPPKRPPRPTSGERWQAFRGQDRTTQAFQGLEAVAAGAAGYETGQTPGSGDDIKGLVGAAAAGASLGGPAGAAIAAAAYVVTNLFGRIKGRKKRAKELARRTRRIITLDPAEVVALPYLRGRFRREALPIYAAPGDHMPGNATGTDAF